MKSVVTIAALLHVALNVLAVTDGAQPASSAPAVRSLRQSADMPTTGGDEEWMAHHQHHHHHVKKVKKIAIPVPVEVPQYIPVPVVPYPGIWVTFQAGLRWARPVNRRHPDHPG
ncbi:hypothetical protein PR003_g21298 [Phytophthora rubi]|uniref:RxLR effector protein n=1 Tax=Phytophthora rubi TaxID=129364 RepID=A0A6A4DI07_9STRA|nr:hypothetical protein PR003_g21298 [Phytophthora rubi]